MMSVEPSETADAVRANYTTVGGSLAWRPADADFAVGRTVSEVVEQNMGYVLVFTDGTAARYGYRRTWEDDWPEVEVFTRPDEPMFPLPKMDHDLKHGR